MTRFSTFKVVLSALVLTTLLMGSSGHAQQPSVPTTTTTTTSPATTTTSTTKKPATMDECTGFKKGLEDMKNHTLSADKGILREIYDFIKQTTSEATKKLFVSFTNSPSYKLIVFAALTLMVTFYAVGFTIGIVQPSFQQALIRLVKIGVVTAVVSPTGWNFFNTHIVKFFQDGTDDLIIKIQQIGMQGVTIPNGASPFWVLDNVAQFVIKPDTLIAIIGAFGGGGPFGLMMGSLLMIAIMGFIRLLLETLKIYAISYVARAMILGVAPIFFLFLLFDRTKQMFISWLNALINLSLQPILLFTFLSFFMVMIEGATADMLKTELCWGDFTNVVGSSNKLAFWRFKDEATNSIVTGEMTWMGSLECLMSNTTSGKCKPFPIEMVGVLTFLILIHIAVRFLDVIKRISSELSNAMVALDSSAKLEQFMQEQNQKGKLNGMFKQDGGVKPTPPLTGGRSTPK